MNPLLSGHADEVGPVLAAGAVADAIIAAIEAQNRNVTVVSRGAYLRVRVPHACVLTAESVEAELGAPFTLPGDLEAIMPAFVGKLTILAGRVEWAR